MAQSMKTNETTVTKRQAKFHRAVALVSQTIGALLLIGMGGAALNDDGRTNWNGAIWGLIACVYLIAIGRWAYKAYQSGTETPVQDVRVVRWFNFATFVFFLLGIAFLIGNIIDPTLYRKMGMDF